MAKEDYQTLSLKLDEVLAALQAPGIAVDEAVTLYEDGLQLIKKLEAHLEQAENTIQRLALARSEG